MDTTQKMASDKRNALQRIEALEKMIPDLLQRIEALEKMIPDLLQAIGKQLDDSKKKMDAVEEVLDAVIGVSGADVVSAELLKARETRATAEMEGKKTETAAMVTQGVLVPATNVTAESVIVISEAKADGTVVVPGWFRVEVAQIKDEAIKAAIVGAAVGTTGTFPNGNTYTVNEIYNVDKQALLNYQNPAQ